jgi:hypothetical protein
MMALRQIQEAALTPTPPHTFLSVAYFGDTVFCDAVSDSATHYVLTTSNYEKYS